MKSVTVGQMKIRVRLLIYEFIVPSGKISLDYIDLRYRWRVH
jgi:hypothetical protein